MSFPVSGKNAIVTGGASGINLAFVKLLVSKGANVVVADLQETAALKAFIKEAGSGKVKVLFQKTDVSKFADLEALVKRAKEELGAIDVMCNGAGVFEPSWSNFWNDTESETYKSFDINVAGLVKGTRLAIRDQLKRSPGRAKNASSSSSSASSPRSTTGVIINISSLAAQYALFNTPLYCTSKAAVSAFTRSLGPLHAEFGIKVVAVAPGMVLTPLWQDNPDKMKAITDADVMCTPDELAAVMLDLVEKEEYEGGTVLEAIKNKTRRVLVDSPLPSGPGSTMSNIDLIYEETMALLEAERVAA